jgi:hypothetical protein
MAPVGCHAPRVRVLHVVVLDRYAGWCVWARTMPTAHKDTGCLVDREVHEENQEDTNPS